MPELILRFETIKKKGADFDVPVPVSVKYGDKDVEQFKFNNPLTDKDLAEIRWYLEQYWYWPSDIDQERARKVEGKLPEWGKALFDAIFQKASNAMRLFGDFDRADGERVLTIDTNEPRILRLPWELLRDEGGYLFSKKPPVSIRRHMHKTAGKPIQPFDLPARILMVTCRPDGAGFIDPRSIAMPLLESLDGIPEQVEVEFLRPPTLRALDDRLRDPNQPRVHIVHFDGHGVYDKGIGLGFLLFEDENHEKHLVDAEQLGTLLNESGIPLMVLNACQSAQPDDRNPFGSVASRLIESGVGGVVAMNYSVLVETAKQFTSEFYGALARGQNASAAMDSARRRLFSDTKRFAFTRPNQEKAEILHLQDWFLPALYQQADELTPFAPTSESTAKPAKEKQKLGALSVLRGSFPPAPLHGFKGRARELLDLERAFATRNIVVLHGFGGQGKTSLAAQAAEWFTRTRLFERAAFLSFETGVSLDFVLNELGNALVEENFQIHQGDKVEAIAQSLKEKSALVVFDNFESVLPNGNAPLSVEELQKLLDASAKWAVKDSRLLVTTRNAEIPHLAFTPGTNCLRKELSGLAASDALELAASILEANSLPRPPRVPLEELLNFLKGHPLSLQLALPQLSHYSAEQLLEQYQTILPTIKVGEAKERNESLEVSLRFSLDRLGADALNWLARLWIFEGGALESALLAITEIPEETWNALKPQLTSTALIRVEEIPGVEQPFIHFHPTLTPYLSSLPASQTDYELRITKYWQVYYAIANQFYQDDSQHPIEARSIVLRELPNLKRALKRTLAAGALDEAVDFATRINRFLNAFGRWRERDEIAAEVERAVNSNQSSVISNKITQAHFMTEYERGERLLQKGRAADAERVFRSLLVRLEESGDDNSHLYLVATLRSIGHCLHFRGLHHESETEFRKAINLAHKYNESINTITNLHTDLGAILCDTGLYTEAEAEYTNALKLAIEDKNERARLVLESELGLLAIRQKNFKKAMQHYLTTKNLASILNDPKIQSIALHHLGIIHQEIYDWDSAERFHKEAYQLQELISDFVGLAKTCNELALTSVGANRLPDAEKWYIKAIELGEKLNDKKGLAVRLNGIAIIYLTQNRLDEAEAYARRALVIKETLDLSSEPWTTYSILAQIAVKRGRMNEVHEWRRKEQESFAAFAGSDTQIKQFEPLIAAIVQAANGDEKAKAYLEGEYPKMQAGGEGWIKASQSIQKLVAGERDLEKLTDGLDREKSLIIRRILQALNGEQTEDGGQKTEEDGSRSSVSGQPQQQGVTLPQLLELVERAAGGDKALGGQLFTAFQQMARADDPTSSALGNVLLRVLVGEREPDLSQLPDELASAVRGLLGRLKNK